MKIVCRTVTGASTTFDVEPDETIAAIKNRMAADYDLASLRLCHKGKVLEDAKSIADLGFADGEVLIVAGKKPTKTAPAPTPQATAAAPAPAPVAQPTAPAPSAPAPTATEQPAAQQQQQQPPSSGSDLPAGVDAGTVEFIMSMGFPDRPSVIHALQCAFGNGDRAVEYLCTGIPAHVEAQFARQQAQANAPPQRTPQRQQAPPSSGSSAPAGPGANMTAEQLGAMMADMQRNQGSPLAQALAGIPQFEQIRGLVRQNPAALPTVMQQLQQHHPDVFALVQANPQEFLDLINAPSQGGAGQAGAGAGAGGDAGMPDMVPTAADAPAIERLVALGGGQWDARAAAIVYLVCRRNEEVAANVLFDNGGLPPELLQAMIDGGDAGGDEEDEESP